MSDGSDISPDAAIDHSRSEAVQTCNENGLGVDEQRSEVMETTPFPPVGSCTASSSVADLTDNESEVLELVLSRPATSAGMTLIFL